MTFKDLKIGTMFQFKDVNTTFIKASEHHYRKCEIGSYAIREHEGNREVGIICYFKDLAIGARFAVPHPTSINAFYTKVDDNHARYNATKLSSYITFFTPYQKVFPYIPKNKEYFTRHNIAIDTATEYCKRDLAVIEELNDCMKLTPKKVIFNNPVTVVLWQDGTKTLVRCTSDDTYDKEKGLALCYMKKLHGNDNKFHKIFRTWVSEEKETK